MRELAGKSESGYRVGWVQIPSLPATSCDRCLTRGLDEEPKAARIIVHYDYNSFLILQFLPPEGKTHTIQIEIQIQNFLIFGGRCFYLFFCWTSMLTNHYLGTNPSRCHLSQVQRQMKSPTLGPRGVPWKVQILNSLERLFVILTENSDKMLDNISYLNYHIR